MTRAGSQRHRKKKRNLGNKIGGGGRAKWTIGITNLIYERIKLEGGGSLVGTST